MTKQKEEPNGTYEWEYAQKVDTRTTGQKILNFIYNPQTHAFLGRTAKSWGGIILFYAIFYSVLALLFAVCMKVLISTLETSQPKWQLEDSIIGTNPGLGFRPRTIDPETASIIWYHANDTKNVDSWVKLVDKFFEEEYTVKNNSKTAVYDCDYGKKVQPLHFCVVKPEDFGPCSKANGYGYPAGKPCVFLKLNRIYRWEPDCYTNKTELPIEMPDELQQLIGDVTDEKRRHNIWVSCEGQSAHDRENMGPLLYYPKIQGFPSYYYPYTHADNYMSPLVAVQFAGIRPGVTVNIECKAWAKNIKHKATSLVREGSVHFEILIDMAK